MKIIYFLALMLLSAIAGSTCIDIDIPQDENGYSILNSKYHGIGIYEVQTGGFPVIDETYVGILDIINCINTSSRVFRICVEEVFP